MSCCAVEYSGKKTTVNIGKIKGKNHLCRYENNEFTIFNGHHLLKMFKMCTVCQSRHILPEFSLAWAPKQTGSLTNPLAWWALISDHFVDNVKWWSNYMTSQTRGRQLVFLLCCFVFLFHCFFFSFPTIYFSLIFYFLEFICCRLWFIDMVLD